MAAAAHEGLRGHCARAGLRDGLLGFLPGLDRFPVVRPELVRRQA
jgi:hypothetical protein